MKLYLDVSCLNRPFDDQRQSRIREESAAIVRIFDRIEAGVDAQFSSRMATIEISAIRDEVRRRRVLLLLPEHIIGLSADVFGRARALVSDGFQAADAVHVAAAEALKVDVFLTCDDRLQKLCSRISGRLRVTVDNPLSWIKERENATDS